MSTLSLAPAFVPATSRARSTVRLTRRDRLAVFLTSLFLVLGVAFMLAGGAVGTGSAGEPIPTEVVTVAPGDTLAAVAAALGWDQFALLGHSMGGMIAQVVAGQVPERVERLILMDTAHGGLRLGDRDTLGAAIHIVRTRGIGGLIEAMAARGDDPLASPAHLRLLDEKPGYRELGERKLRAASPAMYVAMLTEMGEQADRLDALARLKMPSLVLVGEQDAPFIRPSERMADVLPDASLTVIPDAGHSPQFENPSAWWAAIETFLAT